jgi:hypothetical protein
MVSGVAALRFPNACGQLALANGFDRFGAGLRNQDDGAPFIPERFPQLASEILLITRGKQLVPIYEQRKRRGHLFDLRCVKEFQVMTYRTDRLPVIDGVAQRAIKK